MDVVTYALCKKQIADALEGIGAIKGEQGLSAYQIAVNYGFSGTESDWLSSLKGYTPVKGVDYMTDSDISEMVDKVLTKVTDGTEVAY